MQMFAPPLLKNDFENWQREVTIWQCATNLELRKQGPALYLSLEEEAKQHCHDIPIEKLISEQGVQVLIDKLETLYEEVKEVQMKIADNQDQKRKDSLENKTEFDKLYNKIKKQTMGIQNDYYEDYTHKQRNITDKKGKIEIDVDKLIWRKEIEKENITENVRRKNNIMMHDGNIISDEMSVRKKNINIHDGNSIGDKMNSIDTSEDKIQLHAIKSADENRIHHSMSNKDDMGKEKQSPRCTICDSTMHRMKKCPHQEEYNLREKQFTAFTKNVSENYMRQFLSETFNRAVLDSGCSKTVCGKVWLDCYINSLSKEELLKVIEKPSGTRFKFGDGKAIKSLKRVIIPARIGNVDVKIETDVVSADIPLLLSKDSMKAAKTTIDFSNDKVIMLNQTLDLKFTTSGHYCVPITNMDETEVKLLFKICSKSKDEKRKVSSKLHLQFGHMPSDKIIKLVKDVGIGDSELFHCIKEAEKICQSCKNSKKRKLRPVIQFALAKEFNEVVSIDLKAYGNVHLFHIIDHSTRYSVVAVIPFKQKEIIVENFMKHWIMSFGCPNKIMSDKGGEFNSELYLDMAELFNVEVVMTEAAGDSIVEKNYSLIKSILDKIRKQSDSFDDAVSWAVSAKNSLTNVYDFSPNELVYGENPTFPTLVNNNISGFVEKSIPKNLLVDHMKMASSSREDGSSKNVDHHIIKKKKSKVGMKSKNSNDRVSFKRKNSKRHQVTSGTNKRDKKSYKSGRDK